jgi:hypothetical protein
MWLISVYAGYQYAFEGLCWTSCLELTEISSSQSIFSIQIEIFLAVDHNSELWKMEFFYSLNCSPHLLFIKNSVCSVICLHILCNILICLLSIFNCCCWFKKRFRSFSRPTFHVTDTPTLQYSTKQSNTPAVEGEVTCTADRSSTTPQGQHRGIRSVGEMARAGNRTHSST